MILLFCNCGGCEKKANQIRNKKINLMQNTIAISFFKDVMLDKRLYFVFIIVTALFKILCCQSICILLIRLYQIEFKYQY